MILNLPIWPFHMQQTSKWVSLVHHHYKQGSDIYWGNITHLLP